MDQQTDHIFVYGTLMRRFRHPVGDILRKQAEFVGEATAEGSLYHFGAYPGMVAVTDEGQRVSGEVYRFHIAPYDFTDLDEYEGCTEFAHYLFLRKKQPVTLFNGTVINSWAYLYNRSTNNGVIIADGRFKG